MPNHVTHRMTITPPEGRTVQEVLNRVSSDERAFDFNRIIPMPQEAVDSIGMPGFDPLWYRWSLENWGTKWNAYNISINDDVVQFDTAWSTPLPVFRALSDTFPDFTFDIRYADEDYGHNFGRLTFDSVGMLVHRTPEPGTPAARVWVFQHIHDWPEEYDEQGNYIEEDADELDG